MITFYMFHMFPITTYESKFVRERERERERERLVSRMVQRVFHSLLQLVRLSLLNDARVCVCVW